MLHVRLSAVAFAALISIHATPLPAQDEVVWKPRPIPAGPDAYTAMRLAADTVAFWRRYLLAECGVDAPLTAECKPHVEAVMGPFAILLTDQPADAESAKLLLGSCDRLRELGCDDAVVQLVRAEVLVQQKHVEMARALLSEATTKLQARKPSLRLRYVIESVRSHLAAATRQRDESKQAKAALEETVVAMAGSDEFQVGQERFYLALVKKLGSGTPGPDDLQLLDRIDAAAGRPNYASLVLRAEHHVAMAWESRGRGAASSIGASDREKFGEHLQAAAAAASEAAQLFPGLPEAPTAMIKVLGPGGGEPGEQRHWFDLAVAAQFDWQDAYATYMHYLQPRWGGSPKAMLAFAEECAATERYDTIVPGLYRNAISYLSLDARDPKALWGDASVQERLAAVHAGELAAARNDVVKHLVNTQHIAVLALGGRGQEAAQLYEKVGKRIEPKLLPALRVTEDWLQKTLRPHLSDYAPAPIATKDLFAGFETAAQPRAGNARPLTAHEQATTARASSTRFSEWIAAAYQTTYDRIGKRDPAWDDDVRQLMVGLGQAAAFEVPHDVTLAEKVVAAGCTDPLGMYVAARALTDSDPQQSNRLAARAAQGLTKEHPSLLHWWVKEYLISQGRRGLQPEVRKHIAAAAAEPLFAGRDGRHFVRCLWSDEEFAQPGLHWVDGDVVAAITAKAADQPWVVHMATGLFLVTKCKHGKLGKAARAEQLRSAARHFTAAHALQPDCPEAATGMILVTTMDPETDPASPREWFDRALDAEIDFQPAFRAYLDSLRPAAGGSTLAMYRFAVECLDSKRFDTEVPLWYAWTLHGIQKESRQPREVWAAKGVEARLAAMFQGYLAAPAAPLPADFWRSGQCLTAWAGGRYEDALTAVRSLQGTIDKNWFVTIGVDDPDLVRIDLELLGRKRAK
ncbi:MAG: hypothetical protein MUC36_14210 [Planctomycetes bacterium]|jgi:hypothetical protein|nr:hypothetical protein [Planctomycetota bacterium]